MNATEKYPGYNPELGGISVRDYNLDVCGLCGKEFDPGSGYYDPENGAVICKDCMPRDLTNCGWCGTIVKWDILNNEYMCPDCVEHYHPSAKKG